MAEKEIEEYVVLANSNPMQLTHKVNEKIHSGWQPLSGVSVSASISEGNSLVSYAQAMVKYK